QAEYRVELAFRESAADLQPLRLLPTMLVAADAVIEGGAVGLLLEDDVDDTGNGIGTVNRRGAAGEDFHPVDQGSGDVGNVGEVAVALIGLRIVRDAPPV